MPLALFPFFMIKQIIGLTGGIATGKSTVSRYLEEKYKLPIYDADIIARQAVDKGSPILKKISDRYGQDILNQNGELNRSQLGEIIFNQPTEKQWLEQQIHPFVKNYFIEQIQQTNEPFIILVIPLLFEAKMTDLVTQIWVVTCSLEQQIYRLINRNNLTLTQAKTRINNQIPLAEKIKQADIVLDNQGILEDLHSQIDQVMSSKFYKS